MQLINNFSKLKLFCEVFIKSQLSGKRAKHYDWPTYLAKLVTLHILQPQVLRMKVELNNNNFLKNGGILKMILIFFHIFQKMKHMLLHYRQAEILQVVVTFWLMDNENPKFRVSENWDIYKVSNLNASCTFICLSSVHFWHCLWFRGFLRRGMALCWICLCLASLDDLTLSSVHSLWSSPRFLTGFC